MKPYEDLFGSKFMPLTRWFMIIVFLALTVYTWHTSSATLAKSTKSKDCWICTHSPTPSTLSPYFATPVSADELILSVGGSFTSPTNSSDSIYNNTRVALRLQGWTFPPWWVAVRDLSLTPQSLSECRPGFTTHGCNRVNITDHNLGNIPTDLHSIQIIFTPSPIARRENQIIFGGLAYELSKTASNLLKNLINGSAYDSKENTCNEPIEGFFKPGWCPSPRVQPLLWYASEISYRWLSHLGEEHILLPDNWYYVCGMTAYKLLPYDGVGTCSLAKLTLGRWTINEPILSSGD